MNGISPNTIPFIPSKILSRHAKARVDYIDSMVRKRFVIYRAAG
jgi:hypothetical protein